MWAPLVSDEMTHLRGSVMVPDMDGKKTGHQPLHMVHAHDFAIVIALAIKKNAEGGKVVRETYNVCPEIPISVAGYARAMAEVLRVPKPNIKLREWVNFQEALGDREVAISSYDTILRCFASPSSRTPSLHSYAPASGCTSASRGHRCE